MTRSTTLARTGLAGSLISCLAIALSACGLPSLAVEKGRTATNSTATAAPETAQGKMLESGFGQDGDYVYPVTLVENTADHAGQTVIVSWNLLDEAGEIVKSESQTESFSFPGQTIAVTTQVDVGVGTKIAAIEPTLLIKDDGLFDETEVDFGVVDATVQQGQYGGWEVSFPVENPTSEPLESLRIGIACRDAQGTINGGGYTFPDLVPPNGQIVADSDVRVSGEPASCKAYIGGPL